jgi:putative CocE/NonD family hydrolase
MDVIIERDQVVKMRDGTILRADVYRPTEQGVYPAVMQRIPYGKDGARASQILDPVAAAASGLVVVVQDTRGQGRSEGSAFYPFRDDFDDGFDTSEWIARLPFSNGRVGAFGVSYGGNSSWQVAVAAPPSLGAIAPAQSPIDWIDGWQMLARDDVLKWGLTLGWTLGSIAESQVRKYARNQRELAHKLEVLAAYMDDFANLAATVPLTSVATMLRDLVGPGDTAGGAPLGYLDDVLHRRTPAEWDAGLGYARSHERVQVPVFLTAGWYDVILGHDLDHFVRMRRGGATREAREQTRLLIGPWSHSNFTNVVGQLDYGRRAMGASLDMGLGISETLIGWFKSKLGQPVRPDDGPRVRLFVQGINRWRDEDDWPLSAARPEPWFLRAGGRLSPEAPGPDEGTDAFVFDPLDPCPTCGGDLVKPPTYAPGPVDQRSILGRRDVLVYTSDVLEHDVQVIGPVVARLTVATTGKGTDWVVKVCDVDPGGRTINVCDGIARSQPSTTADGRPFECELDLWTTAMVFRAGHRIRVIVTSSDFPRYERNPNTGQAPWEATVFEPALQRVFHDSARMSCVVLPVVS